MPKYFAFAILFITFATVPARADILVLADGDTVSGHLVRVADAYLVFRTKLKGQLMAPMDTVKQLNTDLPLMLSLKKPEEDAYGRLGTVGGKPHLFPLSGGESTPIELARIVSANPLPASLESPQESGKSTDVSVGIGAKSHIGTLDYSDLYTRIGVDGQYPNLVFKSETLLEGADTSEFPRFLESSNALAARGESKWQPEIQLNFKRDTANALDWRTDLSLGVKHDFSGEASTSTSVFFALAYLRQTWDSSSAMPQNEGEKTIEDSLNLKLGLRYQTSLSPSTSLNGEVYFFQGLANSDAFQATSKAYLQKNLGEQLHLRLDLVLNYSSNPPFSGLDPWTASFGAGIGWDF